ncbi:MAG: tetratricopeptide repeat protein [Myxococcota bacterium]
MAESATVQGLVEISQEEVALLLESGYLYLEMQKPREAEDVFSGVAALVPHSEIPLICLGNLYFSQGRFERALKFHRDALKRNPESALAQAHAGEALLFMKRRADAKSALEQAVALDPEGDAATFARSLLDAMAAEVV